MTLHAAIEKLLKQKGHPMTTYEIADELNNNKWYQKKDESKITDYQIHGRTKNYPQIFTRNGSTVFLVGYDSTKSFAVQTKNSVIKQQISPKAINPVKDEHYVLDLCDKILGLNCLRQHKFDFLLGDINSRGKARRLPVDGYYEKLNLVIEYCERQHSETVAFFDKSNRITISGVHRGEQRTIYDKRRREALPKKGIDLIEISYSHFKYNSNKRIIRDSKQDEEIVRKLLIDYINKI